MTALEPRDADVTPVRPRRDGEDRRPRQGPSGAQCRDRLRRPADRLRGDRRRHRDAGRRAGAGRHRAVRVRLLRVLHHQPLRDGALRAVGRPATGRCGRWPPGSRPSGPGCCLSGTAGAMWLFILGRAVQGLGGGLVIVALYVVVGRAYPERLRPAIMAAFAASWVVPSVVGPLAVRDRDRTPRLALGLRRHPGAGRLPAGARAARDPADGVRARGRGARRGSPSTGGGSGWRSGSRWARGCCSTPARSCGGSRCSRPSPGVALLVPAVLGLLPRGTYRAARGLPSVVLLRGVAAGSFIAAESFVPLMLVTQRGLSPTLAGLSLAVGGATWALGSYVQSRPRVEPYRERLMVARHGAGRGGDRGGAERADRRRCRCGPWPSPGAWAASGWGW